MSTTICMFQRFYTLYSYYPECHRFGNCLYYCASFHFHHSKTIKLQISKLETQKLLSSVIKLYEEVLVRLFIYFGLLEKKILISMHLKLLLGDYRKP